VVEHNSKLRLILDLVCINHFIKKEGLKFEYEGIKLTSLYFTPNGYMFSVDLEKAYHHVDMHQSTWDYLGSSWLGKTYTFAVMPFGPCPACWVFTKLTNELVSSPCKGSRRPKSSLNRKFRPLHCSPKLTSQNRKEERWGNVSIANQEKDINKRT
jgi:hypothetical protein